MEPKLENEGHGYYRLAYWSYKDQVWKHLRGSRNLGIVLQQQLEYWPAFVMYISKYLSFDPAIKVEGYTDQAKTVNFFLLYCEHPVKITFKKKNLLDVRIKSLAEPFAMEEILLACKKLVLDNDFLDHL